MTLSDPHARRHDATTPLVGFNPLPELFAPFEERLITNSDKFKVDTASRRSGATTLGLLNNRTEI